MLESLAERPLAGADVQLISPWPSQFYSGMLPGYIGGDYVAEQASIDLTRLCDRAGVTFRALHAMRIDVETRSVETEAGSIPWELLSLDIGSIPRGLDRPGVAEYALPIRPFERAREIVERLPAARRVVVVGAGAGGVEVALAIGRRLPPGGRVTLVGRERPLDEFPVGAQRRIARLLAAGGIAFVDGDVAAVEADGVEMGDGQRLEAGLVVWATGPAPHPLIAASPGLPQSDRGYLAVGRDLRVAGQADVWAAGDCADLRGRKLPRAGVFAVREGPVLTANLRAALGGDGPQVDYEPQDAWLSILNTADGRGLLRWRRLTVHARWAWWLKDRIDRRWIARFRA